MGSIGSDRGVATSDDAFISYSHVADGMLAPAVQLALERFGRPWYARSGTRIFRDETGLGLTPDLWGEIEQRLAKAKCFILLAAPDAARSEWVEKEVRFWLDHRAGDPLLIVLTDGHLAWSDAAGDFDWGRTDALPPALRGRFKQEPLWADLSWAKTRADLSLANQRFFVEVAKVVAGMKGVPLESVFDEAAIRQRRAARVLWGSASALVLLTVLALVASVVGFQGRTIAKRIEDAETARTTARQALDDAESSRRAAEAESRRIASEAASVLQQDPELSLLLGLEAISKLPTPDAERALRAALVGKVEPVVLKGHSGIILQAAFMSNGSRLLTSSLDGTVRLW